jgi:hypothetical protein
MDINHDNISVYTETLFALARDAWRKGRLDAFDFIRGYLVGLVPSCALDAFINDLDPDHSTNVRTWPLDDSKPPKPNGSGGSLVTNPVPDKPLAPVGGLIANW